MSFTLYESYVQVLNRELNEVDLWKGGITIRQLKDCSLTLQEEGTTIHGMIKFRDTTVTNWADFHIEVFYPGSTNPSPQLAPIDLLGSFTLVPVLPGRIFRLRIIRKEN